MWFLQVSKNIGACVAFRAAVWCGSVQRSAWKYWCPICAWCSVPHARSKTPRGRIPQTNQSPHTNRTICTDEGARTRLPWRPLWSAKLSLPSPSRRCEVLERAVDLVQIQGLGIKCATDPVYHLLMLGVLRVL